MSGSGRTSGPNTPGLLDSVSSNRHVLVLPNSDNQPVLDAQGPVVALVTVPVAGDLCAPPFGVRLRGDRVFGTAVPEAAVDLNDDPRSTEHDVGSTGKAANVDTVTHTTSMKLRPEGQLRTSPRGRQVRHERGDLLRRRRRPSMTHG